MQRKVRPSVACFADDNFGQTQIVSASVLAQGVRHSVPIGGYDTPRQFDKWCEKPDERDSNKAVPIAVTPHRLIAAEVPFELSPSPQDILNILQYIQGEQGRCALGTYRNMFAKLCDGRSDLLLHALLLRFYYNRNLIALRGRFARGQPLLHVC